LLIKSRRRFFTGIGPLGLILLVRTAAADNSDNTVYLTFDDGYVGTEQKAMALSVLGVTGTFFMTGQAIEWHPAEMETALSLGNRIANHTYGHANLTTLSRDRIASEIQRCEDSAQRVLGVTTAPLLHAPYFADNATVRAVANQLGFRSIQTNWDTADWSGTSAAYISARIRPGVVTMHSQARNTVAALYAAIPGMLDQGYSFAVLS